MQTPAIQTFGERQRRLLTLLLETKRGLNADDLAERLRISRSAVHQHLSVLKRDGYLDKDLQASAGGRPGYAWRLTERGTHLFPKQYALFSELLIRGLKDRLGSVALIDSLRELGQSLAAEHAHRLNGKTPQSQIKEVANILVELGYQSRAEDDPDGELPMITAHNCVFHNIAAEHREVCELDLALIGHLLSADVEHSECMVRGGQACRFRVRPIK